MGIFCMFRTEGKTLENNYFKLFIDDLSRLWNGLETMQKMGIIILSAITLFASAFFITKSMEPNWSVLYSDLSPQDAASVSESLKKSGYAFKLSADKKTVMVPQELQDELRIYVAENNLIQDSSPGFELLDAMQLGSTDFKNKLTKQRIYQGELTRSIEKMSGVRKARVQIADPERSVFQDKDDAPTASVMLILEPGYKLKTSQIKAIKNLVAYAIPRLTPEKVFLTDQSGNNLSDDIEKNSNDIESYKTNFENQTAKKIQDVLDKIVGPDNASVQVSADIDFNSTRSTIESYIPVGDSQQGVLTSSQTETENYENPNPNTSGIATGTNNPPPVNPQNGTTKNLNYQKEKTSANYSVSKEIKQIIYAPGSVKRMTVAVAVNKILTAEEKEELKNLIASASGADMERGDVINVTSLEFSAKENVQAAVEKEAQEFKTQQTQEMVINKIIPMMVILILGLVALFIFRSMFGKSEETDDFENSYQEQQQAITDSLIDKFEVESLPQIEAKLNPELDKLKTDLTDTIMSDPSEAAKILISYIKD